MEHQVAILTRELKDKDRQLQEERQISDRVGCQGGGGLSELGG